MMVTKNETQQEEQKTTRCFIIQRRLKRFFAVPEREIIFTAGLQLSIYLADYEFMVLITLLTGVWELTLFHAVILTNIQSGVRDMLLLPTAYIADTFLGKSWTLVHSSFSYLVGLLMLRASFPHHGFLFYLALVLVTLGQCGTTYYSVSVEEDEERNKLNIQEKDQKHINEDMQESKTSQTINLDGKTRSSTSCTGSITRELSMCWLKIMEKKKRIAIVITGLSIAVFVFPVSQITLRTEFLVIACGLGQGSIIFLLGRWYYPAEKAEGSPLSPILHVVKIAIKKHNDAISRTQEYFGIDHVDSGDAGDDNNQVSEAHTNYSKSLKDCGRVGDDHEYEQTEGHRVEDNHGNHSQIIEIHNGPTDRFRLLNRATLYDPNTENPTTELKNGRLCTVKEVEETKRSIRLTLLSSIFFMYGIMTSVSNTFFVEQAAYMDTHLNSVEIPIQIFLLSSDATRKLVSGLSRWVLAKRVKRTGTRFYGALRVGLGMLLFLPCFTVAFFVEAKRRKASNNYETISAFWLLPQLLLMGAMDGLALDGIGDFFSHEMSDSLIRPSYGSFMAEGITGVGHILSLSMFSITHKTTEKGDHPSWFGYDLDSSHLHYYYALMGAFGFISLVLYTKVAVTYSRHQSSERKLASNTPSP
ncbi:protein NRT1/ PTR FAMILY 5.4-like [Beta vulgaris subsp. vulgaris]|uniref:protein NRT1/ PTR FAMILY 5.4-like n=1 Tax=Beta vulgaris subsp. vulgaris TaxID=3555 RepID=UPI002037108C|nr:protein NRT1/ PTR FAMILY 5.4-like [Beta vulgaris subsp. vulgaris]